jgi:hypothetical protein
MIKKRHMDRAAPSVVNEIRRLQPYKGGDQKLRAIHDFDIADKHRTLIPVASAAAFGDIIFGRRDGPHISVSKGATFGPVAHGFVPFIFDADANLNSGQEIKTRFFLTFSPLDPLGGHEVVTTLHSLVQLVNGIVESFDAICFPKSGPLTQI